MSAPAHNSGTAGQVVNVDEKHQKLSDYIRSINRAQALDDVAQEKKLTFEEWFKNFCKQAGIGWRYPTFSKQDMEDCWNAALTQGKKDA